MVKRLRRRPLTAETGVRFPYELLTVLEQPNPKGCRKLRMKRFAVFFISQESVSGNAYGSKIISTGTKMLLNNVFEWAVFNAC